MSQNLKVLVSSVTLVLLGIFADHFLVSKFESEKVAAKVESNTCTPPADDDLKSLRTRLAGISEKELHDYLATNSAEDKLRKADEILAKVMQIFVADIGYKISAQEMSKLGQPSVPSTTNQAVDTQPTPKPLETASTPTKATVAFHKPRLTVSQILNDAQEKEFLKTIAENEFSSSLKASKTLTKQMAQQLNGRFAGFINFSKDQKQWKAEMTFEGEVQSGKLQGSHDILLSDAATGKSLSHSRGRGELDRSYSSNEGAYIIEVGGDYLELYYFPALEQLSGYFLEIQKGEYKRVGTVVMQRL